MKPEPLSAAERNEACKMLRRIWDEIGSDVLDANGGDNMTTDHVIEVVLDASRPEEHARRAKKPRLAEWFRSASYAEKIALGAEAFGAHSLYGR